MTNELTSERTEDKSSTLMSKKNFSSRIKVNSNREDSKYDKTRRSFE